MAFHGLRYPEGLRHESRLGELEKAGKQDVASEMAFCDLRKILYEFLRGRE